MAAKIKSIDNFLINRVKELRIAFNLFQKDLSRGINDNPNSNYVSLVENNNETTGYNDHQLNIFANIFSKKAEVMDEELLSRLGLKRKYSIADFYPDYPLDEEIVEKDIKFIPNTLKASGALFILVESKDDFLNDWHNSKEFSEYCNAKFNNNWTRDIFNGTLAYAHGKGLLERESEDSPKYRLKSE